MSTPGDLVGLAAARYPWGHLVADSREWPVNPCFLDTKGVERKRMRSQVIQFVRGLVANQCPQSLAVTLASCKFIVAESTIEEWLARVEAAPPGATEVPTKPLGRPPKAWKRPGAEDAYQLYRAAYVSADKPNSAACWRRVNTYADERGWIIPGEAYFRRRLRQETPGER